MIPGPPALVMIAVLRPVGSVGIGKDLGQIEQLGDRLDAETPGLCHQGVVQLVGPGQRAGVRRSRGGTLRPSARS